MEDEKNVLRKQLELARFERDAAIAALAASSPPAIAPAGWNQLSAWDQTMLSAFLNTALRQLDDPAHIIGARVALKDGLAFIDRLSAAPSAIAPPEWVAKVRDHLMRAASDILVGSNRNENLGVVSNRIERGMWHISEALALIPEQGEG